MVSTDGVGTGGREMAAPFSASDFEDREIHRFVSHLDWENLKGRGFKRVVQSLEQGIILRALEIYNWRILKTAKELKMPSRTLQRKIKRYGLKRPR